MSPNPTESKEQRVYPFYIKATVILIGLVLFFPIFNVLASVLVPFAFAGLFAVLLNPLFNRLDRKFPRILAIIVTLLVATLFIAGLFYFLSTRIAMFSNDLPLIKEKLFSLPDQSQKWGENRLGSSAAKNIDSFKTGSYEQRSQYDHQYHWNRCRFCQCVDPSTHLCFPAPLLQTMKCRQSMLVVWQKRWNRIFRRLEKQRKGTEMENNTN